jgi:nucleoside-diphosphate-sugar epimerase
MKKYLVIGASGFVGSRLVQHLLAGDCQIMIGQHARQPPPFPTEKTRVYPLDILTPFDIPGDVNTVYYCAGEIRRSELMYRTNVEGVKNVVNGVRKINARLVYLSSAGVVGMNGGPIITEDTPCKPQNEYEQTKLEGERIVIQAAKSGLRAQVLRPTMIIGAGRDPSLDSFLHLLKAIGSGRYVHINKGRGLLNIVHLNEVARAMHILDDDALLNAGVYFINMPISFKQISDVYLGYAAKKHMVIRSAPYGVALWITSLLSLFEYLSDKKMPLSFSRLSALMNEKSFSQDHLLAATSYRPLHPAEWYIQEVCQEYIAQGLLYR